jgi:predicted RNA methylase
MKIPDHVLSVLSRCATSGNALTLPEQLDRPDYIAVNKVIEAAGGKWNRGRKAHLFEGDAAEAIEPIFLTGEIVDRKQEFQQFWTPPALADRLVALAEVRAGHLVLEPSAGIGNIVRAIMRAGSSRIVCYDTDEKTLERLRVDCDINWLADDVGTACCDFLEEPARPVFDRIVMNPPFSNGQDVRHVSHAFGFLKPGGRLVAVMAAGVRFRQDKLRSLFRKAIVEFAEGSFIDLPDDSFAASGTNVRTCICVVQNGVAR